MSVCNVHVVSTLACILLETFPACDEVDTILRFAGLVYSDPVLLLPSKDITLNLLRQTITELNKLTVNLNALQINIVSHH